MLRFNKKESVSCKHKTERIRRQDQDSLFPFIVSDVHFVVLFIFGYTALIATPNV